MTTPRPEERAIGPDPPQPPDPSTDPGGTDPDGTDPNGTDPNGTGPDPPDPSATLTRPSWWRRPAVRAGVVVVTVLLLVVGLTLVATSRSSGGDLDPRSAKPSGTLALAELLRDRGLTVTRGASAGAATTLVVPFAGRLSPDHLGRVLDTSPEVARIVLLVPSDVPGTPVTEGRLAGISTRAPDCPLPAAVAADRAEVGGRTYRAGTASCYGGSLVTTTRGAQQLVLLGTASVLTNETLDQQGNAALALGLLSGEGMPGTPSTTVVWYQPSLDPAAEPTGLIDLLPDGVLWAVLQLVVGVGLAALSRGRRFGPVVEEPLPVVVPAAETVEGRARLYAAGRARGAAAEALRGGVRARLGNAVDQGAEPDPTGLVTTVAARSGRHPEQVAALLYGPAGGAGPSGTEHGPPAGPGTGADAPPDDAALLRLADEIDHLEREVRGR